MGRNELLTAIRALPLAERERMRREFRHAGELKRHGYRAGVCAEGVVVLYNEMVWLVVGGSVASPSLKLLPEVIPFGDHVWWA